MITGSKTKEGVSRLVTPTPSPSSPPCFHLGIEFRRPRVEKAAAFSSAGRNFTASPDHAAGGRGTDGSGNDCAR